MPDSAALVGVGMFIAICSLTLGSEVECLQIAFPVILEETNADIATGLAFIRKNGPDLNDRDGHGIVFRVQQNLSRDIKVTIASRSARSPRYRLFLH
jgi:hypothetical protein